MQKPPKTAAKTADLRNQPIELNMFNRFSGYYTEWVAIVGG
jgi:hypothetical protein